METIFKVDTIENLGENWLIADFGADGADNKHYILTTDHVHASELHAFSKGAKADAELVARLLNEYFRFGRPAVPRVPQLEGFEARDVTIPVDCDHGTKETRTIPALCAGPFAVHEPVAPWRRGFTVTHLTTGLRLFESPTREQAKEAISIMLASSVKWDELTAEDGKGERARAQLEWLMPVAERGLMEMYGETLEGLVKRLSNPKPKPSTTVAAPRTSEGVTA